MEEKKMQQARLVFDSLCAAIDRRQWNYKKDEEALTVNFGVQGDDIPMNFVMVVDAQRQLLRLLSPLPFHFSEGKRVEGAVAACAASYGMADGSFDFDPSDGSCWFRMTASFRESLIGDGLFQYLISCSVAMVDKYNDQFLAIDKGFMSINDFIAKKG